MSIGVEMTFRVPENEPHHVKIDATSVEVPDVAWKEGEEPPKVGTPSCCGSVSNEKDSFSLAHASLCCCIRSHPLDPLSTVDDTITASCYRPAAATVTWHI